MKNIPVYLVDIKDINNDFSFKIERCLNPISTSLFGSAVLIREGGVGGGGDYPH